MLGGEAVDFEGQHFTIHSPPALPPPVNGTIPIWIGGHWPNRAPFTRAARYDGVVPRKVGMERGEVFTVEDLEAMRTLIGRESDFDYVMSGLTASPDEIREIFERHIGKFRSPSGGG